MNLDLHRYDEEQGRRLQDRLIEVAGRIPGVDHALSTSGLPPFGGPCRGHGRWCFRSGRSSRRSGRPERCPARSVGQFRSQPVFRRRRCRLAGGSRLLHEPHPVPGWHRSEGVGHRELLVASDVLHKIMRIIRTISFALLIISAAVTPALAQNQTSLVAGGGVMTFDLSGTGTVPAFTARVSRTLGANFVVEGGVLFAKPDQQFGDSTLIAPEAQLQFHLPVGRVTPYLGAGIGVARETSDVIEARWTPTVSFGGGTRIRINERAGLFGELRIRGYEWNFVGTMADAVVGVAIKLGQ
jgi:hypothetical protein